MKISMLLLLLASSVGVALAQTGGPNTADSVDPWLKAGGVAASLAALIWVVQHLLRVTIPNQERTFQGTLDKIVDRSEKHDEQFRDSLASHTQHCEQVQQRWIDQLQEK